MSIDDQMEVNVGSEDAIVPFGRGWVRLSSGSGAPVAFIDDAAPERRFLLDDSVEWHSSDHAWGNGALITTDRAARWNSPSTVEISESGSTAKHLMHDGLELLVTRRAGEVFEEIYELTNHGDESIEITGLSIQTPVADLYDDSHSALHTAVHAHIFTGGGWAWLLAQPMSGQGRSLGLIVREGELWSYSIESRNIHSFSNARGHISLNITDAAHAPDAFGGQPHITLDPGASYRLRWELDWYDNISDFIPATDAPATLSAYSVPIHEQIQIQTSKPVTAPAPLQVEESPGGYKLSAPVSGSYSIDIGAGRTEVLFHEPVRKTVESRTAYILNHQRGTERPGTLAGALLPVDITTKLTNTGNGWTDWSDGSERIGMALLLQRAVRQGWVGSEAEQAVRDWAAFAREHLLDNKFGTWRGSQHITTEGEHRLYDAPWLAQFFGEHASLTDDSAHLDVAANILFRAIDLGIARFLAIGLSHAVETVADLLDEASRHNEATRLRRHLLDSAEHFLAAGTRLPAHEVNYEQSIVAPLVELFSSAHRISGDQRFQDAAARALPWLLAFGGPQPHSRLHGISIRHWDGFWFGKNRQWGDVFPHHWSALTSSALSRLPEALKTPSSNDLARTIMRANMSNYFSDGSATAAFVFPSSVDGTPAHTADPLANDQDWHLAIWLRLAEEGYMPLD